jgi:hypothetical protein
MAGHVHGRCLITSPVRLDTAPKKITLLLLLALLLRLVFLPYFEGDEGDWTHRTVLAYQWLQHPYLIEGTTPWPILNYLVPAVAIKLSGELFWSVRILYLLIALSNIYMLFLLVRELLDDRSAWLAAFLIAINPYHIRCSLNGAMSEPAYVSLVLLALFWAARYRQSSRVPYLLGAGLAINLATMFRFDAALWGAIAGFLLLVPSGRILPDFTRRSAWTSVIILGLVCAVYPIFLSVRWYQLYGNPLYVFHTAQVNAQQFFASGRHPRFAPAIYQTFTLVFWPASAFLVLTPLVTGLAFAGLVYAVRRKHVELSIGYALFSVWLMYSAYRHTIQAQFRYTLILQVLLSAYFWFGVEQVRRRIPSLYPRGLYASCWIVGLATWASIVTITFIDVGIITRQLSDLSPIQPAPYAARTGLNWIREHVKPGERVLVMPDVRSAYLSLTARDLIGDGRIERLSIYRPDGILVYTRHELEEVFRRRVIDTNYVLTQVKYTSIGLQDGIVKGLLSPPAAADEPFERYNVRFTPTATFGPLRLYRVSVVML